MLKKIEKYTVWIVSGLCSVVMAACYGPQRRYHYDRHHQHLKIVDISNKPIAGLQVTLEYNGKEQRKMFTQNGVDLFIPQNQRALYKVYIDDVDGEKNGGTFESKELNLKELSGSETIMMERI